VIVTDPAAAPGADLCDEQPAAAAVHPAIAVTPANCKNPRRLHPCRIA
jgi:hypothetical protein